MLEKITLRTLNFALLCLLWVFGIMLLGSVGNLPLSIILASLIVGLSFGVTKNIVFPSAVIVVYNLTVSILRGSINMIDISLWISQGLFLVGFVFFNCFILSYFFGKNDENSQSKLNNWILINSIFAGLFSGILIIIF